MPIDDQEQLPLAVMLDQPLEELDEHELVEVALEQLKRSDPSLPIAEIMFTPNRWPVAC